MDITAERSFEHGLLVLVEVMIVPGFVKQTSYGNAWRVAVDAGKWLLRIVLRLVQAQLKPSLCTQMKFERSGMVPSETW